MSLLTGEECEDGRSLKKDINGNPMSGSTKKQHLSDKTTDSRSSDTHSRAEFSDLNQGQMSSTSDSAYSKKKAKKMKREQKEARTTQAKDIPGNRGDQDIETLLNYIENGRKKQ